MLRVIVSIILHLYKVQVGTTCKLDSISQCVHSITCIHRFRCCNQKSRNFDAAKLIPGCKKGKHCSEHHENYTYAAYTTFMMDTVS